MSDKKYAEQLLALAEKDLTALRGMIADQKIFDDAIFGFHAQQAVEKSLKALLAVHEIEFKKTHDLTDLFAQITNSKMDLPEDFLELQDLTDFAVGYRYDLMYDEEPLNRQKIFEKVNELFNYVKQSIQEK